MKEFISTICMGREITLLWRPEREEIPGYISQGFVPIEMAEGQDSFVDFRTLDHHNIYSRLPLCLRHGAVFPISIPSCL